MFSNKFIQRFLKACQVVVLTGTTLKTGNNFDIQKFPPKELLKSDKQKFWQAFNAIREEHRAMEPNLGYYALVDLERRFEDFTLITTSIDGLHSRAGNTNIIELRGNILRNKCEDCGHAFRDDTLSLDPHCPECGSANIVPDVNWFGETLSSELLTKAQRAAAEAEVFVTAGFDDQHKDVRALPLIAKANGAYLLEMNRERTAFSADMDESVIGNPAKLLTAIVLILEKLQ